jgi:hypothetical protein
MHIFNTPLITVYRLEYPRHVSSDTFIVKTIESLIILKSLGTSKPSGLNRITEKYERQGRKKMTVRDGKI